MKNIQKIREWQNVFLAGMYIVSMTISFLLYGCFDGHWKQAYQSGIFVCVLLIPLWLLLRKIKVESKSIQYEKIAVFGILIFGITMISVLISVHMNTHLLWIGGCILLMAMFPNNIGIGFFLVFGCLFCFVADATVSYEIFMFLVGLICCGSVAFLKKGKHIVFVILADLIISSLLFLLMTGSIVFKISSLISIMGLVLSLLLARYLYYIVYIREEEVWNHMVKGDFPLLVAIRKYSKSLCVHCVDVSELSVRAAKEFHCNERLCRAGGLYHEAVRIYGKQEDDYSHNIKKLMRTYHVPKEVENLILQLYSDSEPLHTKEAAIVSITDQILSSIDYLEKRKKKKNNEMLEKLIEHVFEKKGQAEILKQVGFSKEEIEKLKDFYRANSF